MGIFDYNNKIIVNHRKGTSDDPFVQINESHIINSDGKVVLTEIPDEFNKVIVTSPGVNWYEIQSGIPKSNEFKVDYINKIITFNSINIGKQLDFEYFGVGLHYLPTDMIYTESDNGVVTETLKQLTDTTSQVKDDAEAAAKSATNAANSANTATTNAQAIVNDTKFVEPYNSTTTYKKNNIVSFNGNSYICKQTSTNNAPPDPLVANENEFWGLISRRGTDGTGTVTTHSERFIATEGQRIFTLQYTYDQFQNRTKVRVGGVPQSYPENYEETSSKSITLSTGVPAGTEVVIDYFSESIPLQSDIQTTVDNHTLEITRLSRHTIFTEEFTATANQSLFTLQNTYDQFQNRIEVSIDGVLQDSGTNYTESANNAITLSEGVPAGTKVKVKYFSLTTPVTTDVEATLSTHSSQLSKNTNNVNSREINVKYPPSPLLGLIGNYDSGDTTKLQAIVNYANSGDTLLFPRDNYLLSKVSWTDKTLYIKGDGVKFKQNANDYIFSAKGGWDFIQTVTSVSGSTITLSAAQTLKAGDIVKLVSDDQLYGCDVGEKQGEFLTVKSQTGSTVEVTGTIRNTYATNVRLAKLKNVSFGIMGDMVFTSDTVRAEAETWNGSYLNVNSCRDVKIKGISCELGYSSFITIESCFNYDISGIIAQNLINDPTKLRWGYGINDKASDGGKVRNSTFINCRHGYTTNGDTVVANSSSIEKYGEPSNIVIQNCRSYGSSNAGFDTHPEGYNIMFVDCIGVGDYQGADAVGAGFQTRCKKVTYINCTAIQTKVGFKTGGNVSYDVDNTKIINCNVIDPGAVALDIYRGTTVEGGIFECLAGNLANLQANTRIKGAKFNFSTSGSYRYLFDVANNAELNLKDIEADFTGSTGTQIRLLRVGSASTGSIVRMSDINVKGLTSGVTDKLTANDANITEIYVDKVNVNLDSVTNGHTSKYAGRTSSGAPTLLPRFIGEEVLDTTNNNFYKAYGTTTTSWKLIS
ncbi:hypothetical protein [uncultured Metabacillus sp.]|uniref:hypothetical protein n=1 Tax=uncultured Metabacillus sp. TaxID=2860135 RepID=UPI002639D37D|nr:hypothetical protein [uncultured Metabacillus sp.]